MDPFVYQPKMLGYTDMNKRHVVAHRQRKMFVYTKEISLER